ncbi:hypothetical protein N9L92_03555, partial [Saprospiraceae bacterium]|nr:hypothetical protein [Saprospiraceae bacterium]
GKYAEINVKETTTELLDILKKQTIERNKIRVKCLIYLKKKKYRTQRELSDHIGYNIRTMERWLKEYKTGGIEQMLYSGTRNSSPTLIPLEVQQGLKEVVLDKDKGFASYVQAQEWVAQKYSIELNYNTIRQHLIKYYKTKIKSPRKSHVKKDKEAASAFLKTN